MDQGGLVASFVLPLAGSVQARCGPCHVNLRLVPTADGRGRPWGRALDGNGRPWMGMALTAAQQLPAYLVGFPALLLSQGLSWELLHPPLTPGAPESNAIFSGRSIQEPPCACYKLLPWSAPDLGFT